jgi:hypothetical protein
MEKYAEKCSRGSNFAVLAYEVLAEFDVKYEWSLGIVLYFREHNALGSLMFD